MNQHKIADFIRLRRIYLSINQEDLAELAGVTTKTIYLVEKGTGNPAISTLEKILNVLGLEFSVHVKKTDK